jgi:hypothetical protein
VGRPAGPDIGFLDTQAGTRQRSAPLADAEETDEEQVDEGKADETEQWPAIGDKWPAGTVVEAPRIGGVCAPGSS